MSIVVRCPSCGKNYKVGDDKAGRKFRCRECDDVVTVPQAAAAASAADPWDLGSDDDDDWGSDDYGSTPAASSRSSRSSGGKRSSASRGKGKTSKKSSGKGSGIPLAVFGVAGAGLLVALLVGVLYFTGTFGGNGEDGTPANYTPPSTPALPVAEQIDASFVPGDTIAAVNFNFERMLKSPLFADIPVEQMLAQVGEQAGGGQIPPSEWQGGTFFLSMDDEAVDWLIGKMDEVERLNDPREAQQFGFNTGMEFMKKIGWGGVGRYKSEQDLKPLMEAAVATPQPGLTKSLTEVTVDGKTAHKVSMSTDGFVSFSMDMFAHSPDGKTHLMGSSEAVLRKMLATSSSTSGPIVERFRRTSNESDVAILLSVETLGRLKSEILQRIRSSSSAPIDENTLKLVEELQAAMFVLDLSAPKGKPLLTFRLETETEEGAGNWQGMIGVMQFAAQGQAAKMEQDLQRLEGNEREAAEKMVELVKSLNIRQDGSAVEITLTSPGLDGLGRIIGEELDIPFLDMPGSGGGFGGPGGVGNRTRVRNSLKEVGLAMHNFHDVHNFLPGQQTLGDVIQNAADNATSPLVMMLPFIEQRQLWEMYDKNSAWDSPANRGLLVNRPPSYAVGSGLPTTTQIRFFKSEAPGNGPKTIWDMEKPRFRDITDGMSNTIVAVIAGQDKAIPWTSPEMLTFYPGDPQRTFAELGNIPDEGFDVLLMDGSVRRIAKTIDPDVFSKLLTANGGEVIESF